MDQKWKLLSKRKTHNLSQVRCKYIILYSVKIIYSQDYPFFYYLYTEYIFSTLEPIIKPVRHRQFTLMEQELPATVYDME